MSVVLYGCETWSLTLKDECRLRVFDNRVLRRIFMSKKDEVTRKGRNYKMTKMKGICEFNAYNRARTKTQSHVKSTNTKMLT